MKRYEDITAPFWRSDRPSAYIPGYRFTNWRDNRMKYHIEIFDYDIHDIRMPKRKTAIIFDYTGESVREIPISLPLEKE